MRLINVPMALEDDAKRQELGIKPFHVQHVNGKKASYVLQDRPHGYEIRWYGEGFYNAAMCYGFDDGSDPYRGLSICEPLCPAIAGLIGQACKERDRLREIAEYIRDNGYNTVARVMVDEFFDLMEVKG